MIHESTTGPLLPVSLVIGTGYQISCKTRLYFVTDGRSQTTADAADAADAHLLTRDAPAGTARLQIETRTR